LKKRDDVHEVSFWDILEVWETKVYVEVGETTASAIVSGAGTGGIACWSTACVKRWLSRGFETDKSPLTIFIE
jgi:hypothetical protein